jgi:hypothetical protein
MRPGLDVETDIDGFDLGRLGRFGRFGHDGSSGILPPASADGRRNLSVVRQKYRISNTEYRTPKCPLSSPSAFDIRCSIFDIPSFLV